jgi:phage terminase small subunit
LGSFFKKLEAVMSRKLCSKLDSTKPASKLVAGEPVKSANLSPWASQEWDKLLADLEASGITLSPAHRCTLVVCATLRADIRDCWAAISENGGAYTKAGTGAVKLHPAAARLDILRRDLTKALALLGLQKPIPEDPEAGPTLEDILNGVA